MQVKSRHLDELRHMRRMENRLRGATGTEEEEVEEVRCNPVCDLQGALSLFQQSLVEHQRASCAAVLLQTEDEVPEVNSCDPLTELLTGGGGRGGACT